jgi:hypothetical protein
MLLNDKKISAKEREKALDNAFAKNLSIRETQNGWFVYQIYEKKGGAYIIKEQQSGKKYKILPKNNYDLEILD